MILPSQKYRDELNTIHHAFEYELIVDVENKEFLKNVNVEDNGHLQLRGINEVFGIDRGDPIDSITMTAETNLALLDGTAIFENDNVNFQGYASDPYLSESNRLFISGKQPIIKIISADGQLYDLPGLTIIFDVLNNDYATDFTISYYKDNELIKSIDITGNNTAYFKSESPSGLINSIQIIFKKTFNPNRRIRIFNIILGLLEIFTGDGDKGITNVVQEQNISPIMNATPLDSLSITVSDIELRYDKENPTGIWKYLVAGKEMKFNYLLPFSDGTRELVPGGIKYLKNPPTTAGKNLIKFEGTGFIQSLTQNYDHGIYFENGISYYDLFYNVLTKLQNLPYENGYPKIKIDDKLMDYKCYIPLPIKPIHEVLTMMCASVGRIIFEDPDGWIHIKENNYEIGDYDLGLQNAFDYPEYEAEIPKVKSLIIEHNTPIVSEDESELHKGTQNVAYNKEIQIPYNLSTKQRASIVRGRITSEKYYAYKCLLTIESFSDTVDIVITGYKINISKVQRIYSINIDGEDCLLRLDLVSDFNVTEMLSRFYSKYLMENKRYKFKFSADPSRRANDLILFTTRFAKGISAMILSSKFSSNGTIGELTLKNYFTADTSLFTGMYGTGNDWISQFAGRWIYG